MLFEERKGLISYMKALHKKDSFDGLSLYDCILRFENICASPLENFSFEKPLNRLLAQSGVKGIEELLGTRFETLIKLVGQPSCHPLNLNISYSV